MEIRTAEDFYKAVKLMREKQKEYVRTRVFIAQNAARRQEAEIDRFIEEREQRIADRKQGALIGEGG
jgi:hypothetical protein